MHSKKNLKVEIYLKEEEKEKENHSASFIALVGCHVLLLRTT